MTELLTVGEVAARLKVSTRTVRRLKLAFVRIGGQRRYDPQDVALFLEASKCHCSDAHGRRSGTPRYKSTAVGLSEALARTTSAKPERTSDVSGHSLRRKLASLNAGS
jgi:excisionase family DNA binding protein